VHPLETELDQAAPAALRATLTRARLTAERHALAAAVGDGILADTTPAQHQLAGLDRHIHNLDHPTTGVVRTPGPVGRTGQTRPRPATIYPIHPAPPAPGRDTGPSL
jgi:anti-sigma factor ChrR (cupin superfamily)